MVSASAFHQRLRGLIVVGGGGGRGTPGLSRYVRPQRLWIFGRFGLKKGINWNHFV